MSPQDTHNSPQVYETLRQASERLGLSQRVLRKAIAEQKLPAYRFGARVIRLKPEDVDALLTPTTSWGGAA